MDKIGFLGLGQMGKPMAYNLIKAGYPVVTCVHRDDQPVKELAKAGAQVMASAERVAKESNVIILSLPDPDAVLNLMQREDGLVNGLHPGTIIIDTGTTGLKITEKCSQDVKAKNCAWLDAPVSGGVWGAQKGTLTFMVGGDEDTFNQAMPVLHSMGKLVVYVGPQGAGQVAKLVNNLMACISTAALSEAFALGVKAGVNVKALFDVVSHSSGSSWVLENAAPRTIFIGNYAPGGRLRTMTKDLDLVNEVAKTYNAPLILGGVVHELQRLMIAKGHGEEDAGVMAKFYEEILGISLISSEFDTA